MPDLYRGAYQSDDAEAINKYLLDTQDLLRKAQENGRKVAFILVLILVLVSKVLFRYMY